MPPTLQGHRVTKAGNDSHLLLSSVRCYLQKWLFWEECFWYYQFENLYLNSTFPHLAPTHVTGVRWNSQWQQTAGVGLQGASNYNVKDTSVELSTPLHSTLIDTKPTFPALRRDPPPPPEKGTGVMLKGREWTTLVKANCVEGETYKKLSVQWSFKAEVPYSLKKYG